MKRNQIKFVASLLLFGLSALALCVQSFAGDKKDCQTVVKDVKFACSHHGPEKMMLTLSLDKGDPQKIEIVAKATGAQWFVTIDGKAAADGNGGKNGQTVKVHPGDSITWSISVDNINHGVAFADQDLAQAMLDFDTTVGKKLEDLSTTLTTQAWKDFGTKLWGTKETSGVVTLASCKVKK
jgi:plastocyanin